MKPFVPEIVTIKPEKVLTVTSVGTPNKVAQAYIGALYGTAYSTKFKVYKPRGKKMEIGMLSCQWPNAHLAPKSKWIGKWELVVSKFVTQKDLLQKDPRIRVKVEAKKNGTVAQVLYLGPYSGERSTIKKLHQFVKDSGYTLAGPHEEVYLTRPTAKVPKTIIRYVVRKMRKTRK